MIPKVLWIAIALTPTALGASKAIYGTGSGNGFKHHYHSGFDFHIGHPQEWSMEETGITDATTYPGCSGQVHCEAWFISNEPVEPDPTKVSTVEISFMLNAPVDDLNALRAWAPSLHGDIDPSLWHDLDAPFVGFSTGSIANGEVTRSVDYYITKPRQVVRVVWQTHSTWRNVIEDVIDSIDRAASPPEIRKIASERTDPYTVGSQACLIVHVNDLTGGFSQSGLKIRINGHSEVFSQKKITWHPEQGYYRACFTVRSSFGTDGLSVSRIVVSNDHGRETVCEVNEGEFRCGKRVPISFQASRVVKSPPSFPIEIAPVANARPDRRGPEILSLQFDSQSLTVRIQARDQTGVYIGQLLSGKRSIPIIPRSTRGMTVLNYEGDLRRLTQPGWNTIDAIILYDHNGFAGMLRNTGHQNYEYANSSGEITESSIQVLNYFIGVNL